MDMKRYIKNGCGCVLALVMSPVVLAVECQPLWHNNISLTDKKLTLENDKKTFTIKDNGQLYFDIHKVKLDPQQLQLLAQYYQTIETDLPYVLSHGQRIDTQLCDFASVRFEQENKIREYIPALKNWHSVSFE